MEIIIIAAMASNRVIGRAGAVPWHNSHELRFFKETTWGAPLIMGRKTFDSIGRPLPGRENIVVSRRQGLKIAGCQTAGSLKKALNLCSGAAKVFVIGGAQIFQEAMPLAHTIILSVLPDAVPGDTFFPNIGVDFKLQSSSMVPGDKPYRVEIYRRS
ncbi:MAG TPA: dihydrofolate reductase [Desulfobacterales bacterium]|nr:dihydrofolate reductase [Desulfobacterales bacterium]